MMVTQFKLKKGVEPDLLPPTRKFRQGGGGWQISFFLVINVLM